MMEFSIYWYLLGPSVMMLLTLCMAYATSILNDETSPCVTMIHVFAVTLVFALTSYVAPVMVAGNPRPQDVEDFPKEFKILNVTMIENKGIFLLIDTPEFVYPKYVVLKWSRDVAERIAKAQQEAAQKNLRGIRGRIRSGGSEQKNDTERTLEVLPDEPPRGEIDKNPDRSVIQLPSSN